MSRLITLLLLASYIPAAGGEQDSLLIALDQSKKVNDRIEIYIELSQSYLGNNYDSLDYYTNLGLSLAEKASDLSSQIKLWNLKGNGQFFRGAYDSAIYYYELTLNGAKERQDSLRQAAMINNIGMTYSYLAAHDTAIHLLLKAKMLREQLKDPKISSTLNNLGTVYLNMDDPDHALPYFMKAAELKEAYHQRRSLSNTFNNIGIIQKRLGNYKESISYYSKSLELAKEFNDKNKVANIHNNLATLYSEQEGFNALAEQHYLEAIKVKTEINDSTGLFNTYNNYASFLVDIGDYSKAMKMIGKAEELHDKIGYNLFSSDGYLLKAKLLYKTGKFKEAYDFQVKGYYQKIGEINEDRNNKIADLEVRFESARKEAEIKRLHLESKVKELEIKRSNTIKWIALIAVTVILIIVGLLIYALKKRQKADRVKKELKVKALEKRLTDLNALPPNFNLDLETINRSLHLALSKREFEVLILSLEGMSNSEISNHLHIAVSTVKFHLRNTYSKLGVNNRKEALEYVVKSN